MNTMASGPAAPCTTGTDAGEQHNGIDENILIIGNLRAHSSAQQGEATRSRQPGDACGACDDSGHSESHACLPECACQRVYMLLCHTGPIVHCVVVNKYLMMVRDSQMQHWSTTHQHASPKDPHRKMMAARTATGRCFKRPQTRCVQMFAFWSKM
jgi:hypothetical protein